ncbi:MAG: 3-isopropylmalate dehydratase, large subunit [Sporomusa sp.]|jgi:3-isopropylmalate/(R)-2-methylmalate dehydratase large subunit|nr:3-isopropylmalate dehydratase, large subunit [Sporomusa sp.]
MVLGQAILAKAAGLDIVRSKQSIEAAVDFCIINDAASHSSLDYLSDQIVYDAKRIAILIDHDTPSGSEAVSLIQRKLINFAKKHNTIFHQGEGVGYQLMLDEYVQQGQIIAGCGEHISIFGAIGALAVKVEPQKMAEIIKTGVLSIDVPEVVKVELTGQLSPGVYAKDIILTVLRLVGTTEVTGKMIEFSGDACNWLTLNDKITICNLAGQTGALSAIFHSGLISPDEDYIKAYHCDLRTIKPSIAKPDSYDDIVDVNQLQNIKVNEVFIGGCSGGRMEDLRLAAKTMKNKKVAKGVRLMIAPITSNVYIQALQEGLITEFIDAGAVIMNQGCSVCWGKSQGIIDSDEVLLSAGSYNAKGYAGAATAKVYIASAATAAASAIAGMIVESNSL